MYLVELVRDYNIYVSIILLISGIFVAAYILAKFYRRPREVTVEDIFLVVLSAALLSGGIFLQLVFLHLI